MTEAELISGSPNGPVTRESLVRYFEKAGICEGMTLLVHSSLSSIGWVCGGVQTVILALEEVLTESGTLVMPTHSGDLSDPANWENPPVPQSWWETIRKEMPAFSRDLTPSRGMGKIAETFRKQDGVVRSGHPQFSFAAWGRNKDFIIQDRKYENGMDDKSPLGRIYELDGSVLLLGVGHGNNSSLHLSEYRASYDTKKQIRNGMPVLFGGETVWREFDDIDIDSDDFEKIGEAFEKKIGLSSFKIGNSESRLMKQRVLVDFAVEWMEKYR